MITIPFLEKCIKAKRYIIQNKFTITNVHFNSNEIEDNGLFFALTQGRRDGHAFIQAAIDNGATTIILSNEEWTQWEEDINYILVEDTYKTLIELAKIYRETLQMPLIAITGSNGKTTTKDILAELLRSSGSVYKTQGNLNNHIGVPLSLLNMNNAYDFGVLEMGMNHAGEIDFLADLVKPDVSVITNVGESHIEYLRTTENIARAKAEIIPHTDENGLIVMTNDILHKEIFLEQALCREIAYVGFDEVSCDYWIQEVKNEAEGSSFVMGENLIKTVLKGRHNIHNIGLAIAVARHYGIEWNLIQNALCKLKITDMRYQLMPTKHKAMLINDAYNASPTSVKASVQTFMEEQGRKIVVLGDMYELGGLSRQKHLEVGEYLNTYQKEIELLVTVGVDAAYIQEVYKGKGIHFDTLTEVNVYLAPYMTEDVALLFKASRGMKFETIVNALLEI